MRISDWYTREEVLFKLQMCERTLQRYAKNGKIQTALRQIPGRKPEVAYHPRDVDKLIPKVHVVRPDPNASNPLTMEALMEVVTKIAKRLAPEATRQLPLLLTLAEAAAYTGAPTGMLVKMARQNRITAYKHRGWRFERVSLERKFGYIPSIETTGATEVPVLLDGKVKTLLASRLEQ